MRRWLLLVMLLFLPGLVYAQPFPSPTLDLWPIIDPRQPLNRQHPLNRAVVGAWQVLPGLSGGAKWYNLAGPYHGTLTNMATAGGASGWGATTRTGGLGEMRFDGTNDHVTAGVVTAYGFPNQQFTLSACVRASGAGYLVSTRSVTACSGPSCSGYFLRIDAGGTFTARVGDAFNTAAGSRVTVTTTALNGAWHHIVVVFTTDTVTIAGNDTTLYHNGVLDQGSLFTSSNGPYATAANPFVFGAQTTGEGFFTGAMDAIWLWNRGLSAAEIPALQSACTGRNALLQAVTLPLSTSYIASTIFRRSRGRVF